MSYNELEGFLNAANLLQIRGLCETKSRPSVRTLNKLKRRRTTNSNVDSGDKSEVSEGDGGSVSGDIVKCEESDIDNAEESVEDENTTSKRQKLLTPELLECKYFVCRTHYMIAELV